MFSQLEKTLEIAIKLNESDLVELKVPHKEIECQRGNLSDLQILLKKYSSLVDSVKVAGLSRKDAEILIARMHPMLIDFQWHIDQVDELLRSILKGIPEAKE